MHDSSTELPSFSRSLSTIEASKSSPVGSVLFTVDAGGVNTRYFIVGDNANGIFKINTFRQVCEPMIKLDGVVSNEKRG